jgi:hypothetical protein
LLKTAGSHPTADLNRDHDNTLVTRRAAAGASAVPMTEFVLVFGLHRMMMPQLFEQAVVLGVVGVLDCLDDVEDGVGRCRRHGKGQGDGSAKNVSHGGLLFGGLL